MTSQDEKVSLVLSIFKGENFVCKNTAGLKCQIEARCYGQSLESGVIPVSSSNSEPVFNSQLAWQFTRRELKEIRVNKETVKVRCLILSPEFKNPIEIGYVILYVKDAFPMSAIADVDPSKALAFPLLGTKEQWKIYQPKLQMQLHIEERSQNVADNHTDERITRRTKSETPAKTGNVQVGKKLSLDVVDSASRSEVVQNKMAADRFIWKINEEDGCFVLGNPSENDDLYILNITIISASYLQALWNNRTPKKSDDDFIWQVKYKAYGCEIKSDPFTLSHDDNVSRRTFIGDKATARIRANGASFFEYLEETAIEFHVVRFQLSQDNELINEEVMGVSFAELQDLAKPDVVELKSTLEIVSEWGYPKVMDQTGKPEVRVVFQLDAVPEFYSSWKASKDTPDNELLNQPDSKRNSLKAENENGNNPCLENANQTTKDIVNPDFQLEEMTEEMKRMDVTDNAKNKTPPERPIVDSPSRQIPSVREKKYESNTSNGAGMQSIYEESIHSETETHSDKFQEREKTPYNRNNKRDSSSHDSSSASSSSNTSERSKPDTSESLTSPEKEQYSYEDQFQSSASEMSDKENLEGMMPSPGTFKVTIGLTKLWLKSSGPLSKVVASYTHPLFGTPDQPVICTATPSSEIRHKKPNYKCMVLEDGVSTMKVSIRKFSEKIINEPMTVEFRKYAKNFLDPTFGFSLIPVGSALLQQEKNGSRALKGCADVLKSGTNTKLGVLHYVVHFTSINAIKSPVRQHPKSLRSSNQQDETDNPFRTEMKKETKLNRPIVDPAVVCRTMEDLACWKMEQEEIFLQKKEQKERDYLRIVAEEVAKRDKEREKALTEKLTDLKKKDKELHLQTRRVVEREDQLKQREVEVSNAAHKLTQEQTNILENTKMSLRRIQEEFQIETSSLQRRNAEYEAELEKYKGKIVVLERKLEEKDEFIRRLTAESHERPDFRISEKMKLLEQENKLLRHQVKDTEKSRDQYKKQSQTLCQKLARLQEERDKQLKDENENLRLQILASKEHKELKKERKAVADLSQTIRVLQDTAKTKSSVEKNAEIRQSEVRNKKQISESQSKKEDEISRLTQTRNSLLSTGAYTQYDMVIKEMERKIVGLAQGGDES